METEIILNKIPVKINIVQNASNLKTYIRPNSSGQYKFSDYACSIYLDSYTDSTGAESNEKTQAPSDKFNINDVYVFKLAYPNEDSSYIKYRLKQYSNAKTSYDEQYNAYSQKKVNKDDSYTIDSYIEEQTIQINEDTTKSDEEKEQLISDLYILKKDPDNYQLYFYIGFKNIITGNSKSWQLIRQMTPHNKQSIPKKLGRKYSLNMINVYGEEHNHRLTVKKVNKNYKYTKNNKKYVFTPYCPLECKKDAEKIGIYLPLFNQNEDGKYVIRTMFSISKLDIVKLFTQNTTDIKSSTKTISINDCNSYYSKFIVSNFLINTGGSTSHYSNIVGKNGKYYRYIEFIPGICQNTGRAIHTKAQFRKFHFLIYPHVVT